jgi:hypothetical protein
MSGCSEAEAMFVSFAVRLLGIQECYQRNCGNINLTTAHDVGLLYMLW